MNIKIALKLNEFEGYFYLIRIWIRQRVYCKNKTIRVPLK